MSQEDVDLVRSVEHPLPPHKQLWAWYISQVGYVQWIAAIALLLVLALGANLIRGG
jgi:hypothetical protein